MFLFANNATSRLAVAVNAVQTSLQLVDGTGDRFPSPESADYEQFALTLYDPSSGTREIVYCIARDGDTLTVSRGEEDTQAFAFPAGSEASLQLTAGVLEYLRDLE